MAINHEILSKTNVYKNHTLVVFFCRSEKDTCLDASKSPAFAAAKTSSIFLTSDSNNLKI